MAKDQVWVKTTSHPGTAAACVSRKTNPNRRGGDWGDVSLVTRPVTIDYLRRLLAIRPLTNTFKLWQGMLTWRLLGGIGPSLFG